MDDLYKAQKDFIDKVRAMSPAILEDCTDAQILLCAAMASQNCDDVTRGRFFMFLSSTRVWMKYKPWVN